ncbi:hypothetical protein EYF80_042709 [Liparis tanakae]|uniref:Uncharacterized protein n=1 Tax=Liparis tanakae TaxID=230148 RepID=A0A4Z2G0Q7_9TELE|nr:hypothetical protein EYF80_042709 [Liparis tanakae]
MFVEVGSLPRRPSPLSSTYGCIKLRLKYTSVTLTTPGGEEASLQTETLHQRSSLFQHEPPGEEKGMADGAN